MGLKVALSNLVSGRSSEFDAKTNSSLLSSVKTATNSKQTNQVIMNLTQQVKDNTSEKKDLTTVDFLRVVLAKQPVVVNDENKSKLPLTTKVSKPPEKMSLEDYNFSFRRAVYDKAMGGFKLTDKEIRQADKALVDAGLYKSIYNRQGTVESFRETQKSQGNELRILAGKENIEYAKRAGQAVLQYQEYQAKQSDANQERINNYAPEALGGFVEKPYNAVVNNINGLSEPTRAFEKNIFGTNYIPELPRSTIGDRSEYWQQKRYGDVSLNAIGEGATTLQVGIMTGKPIVQFTDWSIARCAGRRI